MKNKLIFFLLLTSIISFKKSYTQSNQLFIPRDIKQAYDNKTRSFTGIPGEEYFQCKNDYHIKASFNPETRVLKGKGNIFFKNNSKENLKYVVLRLYPEVYRKGAIRGRSIHPEDAGTGIDIRSLKINGKKINLKNKNQTMYKSQTIRAFAANTPSGEISRIEIEWETLIPDKTHERYGRVGPSSFFIAYWYPQVSVYDDINGWDINDWNNLSEMYNEYGDFTVDITLPHDYIAWATGTLTNSSETLSPEFHKKYIKSENSAKPVKIITEKDLKDGNYTLRGENTWIFEAKNVNDFAMGISREHVWTSFSHKQNGYHTHVHIPWMPSSINFEKVPEIAEWLLKQFADSIPGIPYPYPSLTVFNGADGMEFPMIVNDKEENNPDGTWFLTAHEVSHTWFPFLVGINQKRHGWIDEGLITMIGVELHKKKISTYNFRDSYLKYYPSIAGSQEDVPCMVNSFYLPDILFQQHDYMRSSLAFWILKDILGDEMFYRCLREFIYRWKGKHPTPYDLFFTFNQISGENLNWFYQPWFIEFAYPDIGISDTRFDDNKIRIELNNYGGMPFPCTIDIIYSEKDIEHKFLDARVWEDQNQYIIELPSNKKPVKIVLDTSNYPDTNPDNNIFSLEKIARTQ